MCLYLPRHGSGDDEEAVEREEHAPLPGEGESILVVEDEATIRQLICEELEDAGYRVRSVEDGPSALRLLQTGLPVDLVITDVGLPGGLNGRQVVDAARVSRPDLRVLFITGYAENAAVGNGLLAPGMEVMTKPFEIAALAHKVREMLER